MKNVLFIIFTVFTLISCTKNLGSNITTCSTNQPLKDLVWLNQIKTGFEQSASATKKLIIQYTYKNKTVFLVDNCNGCADNLTTVYNCSGEKICEFGGIAGLNTCPDFEQNATNKIILWEN